jgi:glutathione S-transferase
MSGSSPPKLKITYFDIEGVVEPVRIALALSGIEYEDHRIGFPEWAAIKPTTPYGTLPLMYVGGDDEKPRTQSGAMLRYVATLNPKLYPSDRTYEIEEAMGIVGDLTRAWSPCLYVAMRPQNFGYPEDYAKTPEGQAAVKAMREKFVATELPKFLKYLADYVDERGGGKFLCGGDEPTIADCLAVPTLRGFTRGHIDHVPTNCLEIEPRIVAYVERFLAVEKIKGRYTDGIH